MERIKVNGVQLAALGGVLAATLVALVSVRGAMQVLSLVLLALAVLRLAGRPERVLVARSRLFDVALLLVLSGALGYLSFSPGL
ncbi:DUF3017 domain-containing protein [Serinibacter arcticus]|uniref:DUF3017 domain-containing protein n=1 Tax=Serinibacter arcticus TaxID=1655435 RepID=A0A4Z1E4W9_9MICO|nr:DUF3017 domain-containing protein [Serinibacter arcticus]TGO06239.1 hypothetical protein SERN_0431 [Serinibacter arcticus]